MSISDRPVLLRNFKAYFARCSALEQSQVTYIHSQKISSLEASNLKMKCQLNEISRLKMYFEASFKSLTEHMGKVEKRNVQQQEMLEGKIVDLVNKNNELQGTIKILKEEQALFKKRADSKIENLGVPEMVLRKKLEEVESQVGRLSQVASWKTDLEKFTLERHRIVEANKESHHIFDSLGKLKEQRYKIESTTSQLINDTQRHFEAVRNKLKKSKNAVKKEKNTRKHLIVPKENLSKDHEFVDDPRYINNLEVYSLTPEECPRPDYIPPRFEPLRSKWHTLNHFDL